MITAVLSDIHSNLPALQSVLADADEEGATNVVCLGDIVGYHAFPLETLEIVRERGVPCVAGNHDLMAVGRLAPNRCGPLARRAIAWTRTQLGPSDIAFLTALPLERELDDGTILVHALPWSTEARMREMRDFAAVAHELVHRNAPVRCCFTGHSHVALTVRVGDDQSVRVSSPARGWIRLDPGAVWFINPGSVGLPRDHVRKSSYVLYDDEAHAVRHRRVSYDVSEVRSRDVACGLAAPPPAGAAGLAQRTLESVAHLAEFFRWT